LVLPPPSTAQPIETVALVTASRQELGSGQTVASLDDDARTQNRHIRNDTRDASRRILGGSLGPICRENCVVSDRAYARDMVRRGSTVRSVRRLCKGAAHRRRVAVPLMNGRADGSGDDSAGRAIC